MVDGPICIRRTATAEEADIIVAWLADHQCEARVLDHDNFGSAAFGVTDIEGIAIVVADPKTASRAESLLKDHAREQMAKVNEVAVDAESTEITCGECGQANRIQPGQVGHVVDCEHCGAYLDVPG